ERRPHRPHRHVVAAAVAAHERDYLVDDVLVVHHLHPAAVPRMRVAVAVRVAVVGVHAEYLDPAAFDGVGHHADDALALVLPLVATGRRKSDHRRAVVPVDDHTHVAAQTAGMPVVRFAMHR